MLTCQDKEFKDMKDITPRTMVVQFFKDMPMKDIDCGMNYVCALNQSGEVYSWGCNTFK